MTRTGKNDHGDITSLCGPWGRVYKWTAIAEIQEALAAGQPSPYEAGGRQIIVVNDPRVTVGKSLKAEPGGGEADYLDNLPDC